jgi:hypothetical protein
MIDGYDGVRVLQEFASWASLMVARNKGGHQNGRPHG